MKRIMLFLLLTACASNGNDSIKSNWTASYPAWSADMGAVNVGGQGAVKWSLAFGEVCESSVVTDGTEVSGRMIISNSTDIVRNPITQPPCSMFDGTWFYGVSGGELTFCQASPAKPCVIFE